MGLNRSVQKFDPKEKSFDKMIGKQINNRQTNGTENEKSSPAIPKPHKQKERLLHWQTEGKY